ncbi:MAG: hypothetical protein ACUVRK_02810 [Spirochaetota bacterium]
MTYNIKNNPFFDIFTTYYAQIMATNDSSIFGDCITGLLTIDEEAIVHMMTNELGNTLMLYSSKLKNDFIQSITLKIDAPEDSHFIPSVVLASAYNSYTITQTSTKPINALYPKSNIALYNTVQFGKVLFSELGGCDIDLISDFLFDVVSCQNEIGDGLFKNIQSLAIIKILELLYNTCSLIMQGDRFKQLPKKTPFAFFAHLDESEYVSLPTFKG